MIVIITVGGTTEIIDEFRKMKNTGARKIGSLVADAFLLNCATIAPDDLYVMVYLTLQLFKSRGF